MGEIVRIMLHPAGRAGLALGLVTGFVAAFMGGPRRFFIFSGLFVGLIAFWQHVWFSGIRSKLPPSLQQQVDKGDYVHGAY